MNNQFLLVNITRFVLLIALQVFLLNVLPFGRMYIMIYPLAILLLPVFTPRVAVLFIAFFTGMVVDWLSNGGGLHMASLTLVGYVRRFILDTFQPRSGWDKLDVPNLRQQGVEWFAYYSLILFSIHHFCYFFLETFSFDNFLHTLLKVILSIIGSLVLVWMISLFIMRNTRK